MNGTVKFFNTAKGFGFIEPDDGGKDVFVHASALEAAGVRSLKESDRVSFELEDDRRGRGKQAGAARSCFERSAAAIGTLWQVRQKGSRSAAPKLGRYGSRPLGPTMRWFACREDLENPKGFGRHALRRTREGNVSFEKVNYTQWEVALYCQGP
jgi:CspA family cold shock protein